MKNWTVVLALLLLASGSHAFAEAHRSDLRSVTGWKFPNSSSEGSSPVGVQALLPSAGSPGFSELVPFNIRSPDQEEAGSCLYMSLTGIAEWYLARQNPGQSRASEGPLDLSERYMMNIAGIEEAGNGVDNWKTDSIFLYNNVGETVLNRDYRFAKGWYKRDAEGELKKSRKGAKDAEYDATYNWIDERKSVARAPRVKLPRFARQILFADPESNQWNTGVMPFGVVEQIKTALREKKAPVQVLYNHFGYWHANVILGYDDSFDNKNCKFVNDFIVFMDKEASDARDEAAKAATKAERERLLKKAAKFSDAGNGASVSLAQGGGCHPRGAFYVRDSIYGEEGAPSYDYDPDTSGEESPYSKPIVMLEYDWVRTMANHAIVVVTTAP